MVETACISGMCHKVSHYNSGGHSSARKKEVFIMSNEARFVKMTVADAIKNKNVLMCDFVSAVSEIGDWQGVNSEEVIIDYVKHMIDEFVPVSHILKAIESNTSTYNAYYKMDLGYSLNVPELITDKEELAHAVYFDTEDYEKEIELFIFED